MIGDWSLISQADLKHKEKEQRGRFGDIDEKISREEYTLDWSQSKVFLVLFCFLSAVEFVRHVDRVAVNSSCSLFRFCT